MLWNIVHLARTTSTMDAALAHLRRTSPAEAHGTIIVAETQSAGRGRHGRKWISDARGDLLASFILQVRASLVPCFPMLCGLAAARTVDDLIPQTASIKWPNDVMVDGRKVCGILAESWSAHDETAVILGFGINIVFDPQDASALRHPSANLREFATAPIQRDDALARLQSHVAELFARLEHGEPEAVHAAWAQRLETLGKTVSVACGAPDHVQGDSAGDGKRGDSITGVAEGVDETGRLLLRERDGTLHAVSAGDVTSVG